MRALVCVAVLGVLAAPAMAAELPQWAYPVAPPAGGPPDNTVQKSLAGSTKTYTAAQINDRFAVLALMTPPLRRTVFLHCQTIANFHARSAKIACRREVGWPSLSSIPMASARLRPHPGRRPGLAGP